MKTMQTRAILKAVPAALFLLASGPLSAGTEGDTSTSYGTGAGGTSLNSTYFNTFLGAYAGTDITSGGANTFVGFIAGGNNTSGIGNVFLGYQAGRNEMGSNKLYIDNCYYGAGGTYASPCTSPLIYGEFDNNLLQFNGETDVATNGVQKSQLHVALNLNGADGTGGGWITSIAPNNFYMSSGTKYDVPNGGWVQESSDGYSVIAGSETQDGFEIFMQQGQAVGSIITNAMQREFQILYGGNVGLGTSANPSYAIATGTGAYLSTGGQWINASSRAYKDNIKELSAQQATDALAALDPVTYTYKADPAEHHVGFIAEDVPPLVATKDRKGLSSLDIVAVLTKVVQQQSRQLADQQTMLDEKSRAIDEQKKALEEQDQTIEAEKADSAQTKQELSQLLARIQRLETLNMTAER